MEQQNPKSVLETSTNIAVLLVAVAALSAFALNYLVTPSPLKLNAGLERGKVFGRIPNIDYESSNQTLLIALNTDCSYCRESLPFYRKLVAANNKEGKSLRIVALFPNRSDEVAQYLTENRFTVDAVGEVKFGPLKIHGTPSMILLNNNGEINDFWVGKLSGDEADHVIRALTSERIY